MPRIPHLLIAIPLLFALAPAMADDAKELLKQQQAAHEERQAEKKERGTEVNDARKEFRELAREMKSDSQQQIKDLDTEFELQRVDLQASHDMKIAEAEAEFQKRQSDMLMQTGFNFDQQSIERMQAEGKAYADKLFALKRESAEEMHKARIANEERKNELLTKRDQLLLAEADSLGLTGEYRPILATPIGDALTRNEEKWNEREAKEVRKIQEHNSKMLSEFRNGEKLRKWEIQVLNEDFKLTWDEKAEQAALDSEQNLFSTLMMQPSQGDADPQAFMSKIAEINKNKKLIDIKYRKIREQNRIKRREQKKEILGG
jgi:hypothetical protein